MKELETERERRWKAEQASKKLLNHIQALQGKGEGHIENTEPYTQQSRKVGNTGITELYMSVSRLGREKVKGKEGITTDLGWP